MNFNKGEDSKWKVNVKVERGCASHTKSEMNVKSMKHDPGYTTTRDLSVVHDWTVKADDDGDGDDDGGEDGRGDVYHPEKIIKTDPDVSDDKTDEKCKSQKKKSGEQFIY